MRDIGKESFKARNSMMETIRGERKEKLSVISIEMVIGRMRRDEFRKRCGVEDEKKWTKNRALGDTIR